MRTCLLNSHYDFRRIWTSKYLKLHSGNILLCQYTEFSVILNLFINIHCTIIYFSMLEGCKLIFVILSSSLWIYFNNNTCYKITVNAPRINTCPHPVTALSTPLSVCVVSGGGGEKNLQIPSFRMYHRYILLQCG